MASLDRFTELSKSSFKSPMLLHADSSSLGKVEAYIDPDNKFSVTDKLSMVGLRVKSIPQDRPGFCPEVAKTGIGLNH